MATMTTWDQLALDTTQFLAKHATMASLGTRGKDVSLAPPPDTHFSDALVDIYPKIARALMTDDAAIKVQALTRLCDKFSNLQEEVVLAEPHVFDPLCRNLCSDSEDVRLLAGRALYLFTLPRYGRQVAVAAKRTTTFTEMLSDSVIDVRMYGYKILLNLCVDAAGLVQTATKPVVKMLIEQCAASAAQGVAQEAVTAITLELVTVLVQRETGFDHAVQHDIVNTLPPLLAHASSAIIRARACACLARLAEVHAGQEACVRAGCVELLLPLCCDTDVTVRRHASRALMNLTISLIGKTDAVACDAVRLLLQRVLDEDDEVKCNCMQTLVNVADHPATQRQGLLTSDATLQQVRLVRDGTDNELVRASAEQALERFLWTP